MSKIITLSPQQFNDYELLDCGNFEKLERFGKYITIRPEPQAVWDKQWTQQEWEKRAHLKFTPTSSSAGKWQHIKEAPEQWKIAYDLKHQQTKASIVFRLGLTSFKHVGIFPEQASNWDFIFKQVQHMQGAGISSPKVLNLFAYTGSFSVYAASGNAKSIVTVDMSKTYINWAKRNLTYNKLYNDQKHEFVQADVLQYIQLIPESTFDLIILSIFSLSLFDIILSNLDKSALFISDNIFSFKTFSCCLTLPQSTSFLNS